MRELDNETVVWPAWCYSGKYCLRLLLSLIYIKEGTFFK